MTTATEVAREAVTIEWLKAVMTEAGYDVKEAGENTLLCKQASKPNLLVKLVPNMQIILFNMVWSMKPAGFGGKKDVTNAIAEANRESYIETFYTDAQDDLWTSSYIVLTDRVTPADVKNFIEREIAAFFAVMNRSGLGQHLK